MQGIADKSSVFEITVDWCFHWTIVNCDDSYSLYLLEQLNYFKSEVKSWEEFHLRTRMIML